MDAYGPSVTPVIAQPFGTSFAALGFQTQLGDVTIRNITSADANFASALLVESFRPKFVHAAGEANIPLMTRATSEDITRQTEKFSRVFIAELEGRPAGLLELKFYKDKVTSSGSDLYQTLPVCCTWVRFCCMASIMNEKVPREHCYVETICVDKHFRGKGIGNALMQFADMEGRKRSCRHIYLYVADDNRAKNLYSRCGYRETDRKSGCFVRFATGISAFVKMEKAL